MRRIVGGLLALAFVLGTGCSRSEEAGEGASQAGATIQARELPAIWADVLVQRDLIQKATSKSHEMWHEECAAVVSAAGELEEMASELSQRIPGMPSLADRRKRLQFLVTNFSAVIARLRDAGKNEVVGDMPTLMITLDAVLRDLEAQFTPEEIGGDSVAKHPEFNPVLPPPPPSPV